MMTLPRILRKLWSHRAPKEEILPLHPVWQLGPDWCAWIYSQPPGDMLVEMRNPLWETSSVVKPNDIHPANVFGVYWRPWNGTTINQGAKVLDLTPAT